MFSRTRIFNNPASLSSAPSLSSPTWFLHQAPENEKLRQLFLNTVEDTKINREISFWSEPVVISFAYITAYTFMGDMKITADSQRPKDIIQDWNDDINLSHQTIEDIGCDSYIDNIIHAQAWWRNMDTSESPTLLDTSRLDPVTLVKKKDRVRGTEVLIQAAKKETETFYTKEAYYRYWKANAQSAANLMEVIDDDPWDNDENTMIEMVVVPNDLKYVMEFEYFRHPPISAILNHMVYKRWILWFMKQFAERQWSKTRIGYVGNPQFYMPDSEEEFAKERDNLLQALMQLKNFGALATPGYNKVEELGGQSGRLGDIFVDSMNFINEEMMFAMMGSMGIRSARGSELATSRVLEQGFMRHCKGMQVRFDRNTKRQYVNRLLPANGEKVTRNSIDIRHSPMMVEDISKTVKAVVDACNTLLFDDWNEPRQILQSVFGTVMDELPDTRAKELMKKFEETLTSGNNAFGSPAKGKPEPST